MEDTKDKNIFKEFKDLIQFRGIYSSIKGLTNENTNNLFKSISKFNDLDLYCPYCNAEKTLVYKMHNNSDSMGQFMLFNKNTQRISPISDFSMPVCKNAQRISSVNNLLSITYECPTCRRMFYFEFLFDEDKLYKIAQYPSLYKISRDKLKQYKKNNFIDEENFDEIYKAQMCAGEGFYVASYTYMRRVFENIIKKIFIDNKKEFDIDYDAFTKKKSNEKIKLIKPYLPIAGDICNPLFKLLSEGIHVLTEEECEVNYKLLNSFLLDLLLNFKANKEIKENGKEIQELFAKKKGNKAND